MANNIRAWSTTAASNGTADADINASEGCPPSSVNDAERQMMAKIKNTMLTAEYLDHGYTATFASATTFASPGDLTAVYLSRRRLMFSDATTTYGTIVSSSFVATNTTVTVVMDSSVTLTSALTAVSIGAQAPTNLSAPANFNKEAYATTAGTSTAYTAAYTPKNVALTNGIHGRIKLHTACGATPTLAIDGLAATTMVKAGGASINANDYAANTVLGWTYDSTLNQIVVEGAAPAAPSGSAYTIKTANYTAVAGDKILADCTSAAWTLTLPASPGNTDAPISVKKFGSYTLTIGLNSKNIRLSDGSVTSTNPTIDGTPGGDFVFAYRGTDAGGQTNEWVY